MTKETAIVKAQKAKQTKEKLMLSTSPLNSKQLLHILQRTPKHHIYTRKGKGGGTFTYVTGVYVKKVLNYVFGWMWDFQVIDKGREEDQVWVQGRLTIKNKNGEAMIVKEQFGRADIKYLKGTEKMVDYGNDLKAATTDALKKCASELGVSSDIYGREEFKEAGIEITGQAETTDVSEEPEYCHGATRKGCPEGATITKQEKEYSKKMFGKPLCRDCQKDYKPKK
jgi:hypothetical protein